MIASTPRSFRRATLCDRNGSAVGSAGRTRIFVTAPPTPSPSLGKSLAACLRTFCSRNPNISGEPFSMAGVNTSVCQGLTATTPWWTNWSSVENRRKSGLLLPLRHAGLWTRRSISSSPVLWRACTWYLRTCLTKNPFCSKNSRTMPSSIADMHHPLTGRAQEHTNFLPASGAPDLAPDRLDGVPGDVRPDDGLPQGPEENESRRARARLFVACHRRHELAGADRGPQPCRKRVGRNQRLHAGRVRLSDHAEAPGQPRGRAQADGDGLPVEIPDVAGGALDGVREAVPEVEDGAPAGVRPLPLVGLDHPGLDPAARPDGRREPPVAGREGRPLEPLEKLPVAEERGFYHLGHPRGELARRQRSEEARGYEDAARLVEGSG